MTKHRSLIVPAVLLGVVFVVIGVIYLADTAHALPSFFPGHVGAGSSEAAHHHVKHAIAAFVLGAACFVFAWFQSGPARGARPATP